ncbi:ABC transporter permease [Clostridium sartagoforme]|uniref:ABC transporter permease n=1 Tax=Clostridium sartagoforme TaxID=84031 RepID=A0A4S2DIQ3_9CLOT|nr:ABC transporter permease [Clostridium sartagoforme]TGY40744.1 ABC transporter permease [Clostridium sartagoforme]
MRKTMLWKDIRKTFSNSWGRFFSIMMLMALGSFALVGLFVTGPDMRETGKHYFEDLNVADITIIGDYGINEIDQGNIEKASDIKDIEYIYLKDVVVENTNISFRIFSKPESISKYEVVEGRMPEADDEIVIDSVYGNEYEIGDTINFTESSDIIGAKILKRHDFKVVGYINSGEILSSINRGQTTAGTGELNSFAVVNEEVFDSNVYMMAKITFKDTQGVDPYSDEYVDLIQEHKDNLSELLEDQPEIRMESIQEEYESKIDDGRKQLDEVKKQLEDAKAQLNEAKSQIESAKIQIEENEVKLNDAKSQIEKGEAEIAEKENYFNQKKSEYDSGISELAVKKNQLESGKEEINTKQKEVNDIKTQLQSGKQQYEEGIDSLKVGISQIESVITNPNLSELEKKQLEKKMLGYKAQLEQIESEHNTFIEEIYNPGITKVNEAQAQIDEKNQELQNGQLAITQAEEKLVLAKAQLDEGNFQLENAKQQLVSAKSEYSSGISQLEGAKSELASKETEYNEKLEEFQEEEPKAEKEIKENEEKLNDARKEFEDLPGPVYSFNSRREIPGGEGYKIYSTVSSIIDSMTKVFPAFLYLVAALVTLTTMTRFVDEERINLGTLKALGYDDFDIIKKFTIYGTISGMLGTVIGIFLGHTLLPYIVYNAYSSGFTVPQIELHFNWKIAVLSIALSIISAVIPAYIVASKELKDKPSRLLLPKPPVKGSKIFIERITPIWSRMSFTHKVTARNIFRYKKRMLMTIFGVAGSVALLFAGFAVQHSIAGMKDSQFGDILKYDIIVAENSSSKESDKQELLDLLKSNGVDRYSPVYYETVSKVAGKNNDRQDIKLIVSEDANDFNSYISLKNRKSNEKLELTDDGAVISERLAELLGVKVGDTFTFTDNYDNERSVVVSNICEMYAGHFIFMNAEAYENVYDTSFNSNANLVMLKNSSIDNTKIESSKFVELSAVEGVVQNTTLTSQIDTIVTSLNKIMEVLIILATLLAIVIIYNLTNINVSERIRELSTIKVLGFFDKEVTMYIYRETIVLSLIGIIAGWGCGILLHSYILNVVPPDDVMFNPNRWNGAYAIPFVAITIILFVLKYYVNNKLKNVDMLEALKSVE